MTSWSPDSTDGGGRGVNFGQKLRVTHLWRWKRGLNSEKHCMTDTHRLCEVSSVRAASHGFAKENIQLSRRDDDISLRLQRTKLPECLQYLQLHVWDVCACCVALVMRCIFDCKKIFHSKAAPRCHRVRMHKYRGTPSDLWTNSSDSFRSLTACSKSWGTPTRIWVSLLWRLRMCSRFALVASRPRQG